MENIQDLNFQALFKFSKSIDNDLAKNNKKVIIANVEIEYNWNNEIRTVETQTYISLDSFPFAKISIAGKDWLNADNFYVEFQTGYNKFKFDEINNILTIENKFNSKMGAYYLVSIKEI